MLSSRLFACLRYNKYFVFFKTKWAKTSKPQNSPNLCLTAKRGVAQILFAGSQKEQRKHLRSPKWRRGADLCISKQLLEEAAIQKSLQGSVKHSPVVQALHRERHRGKFRNCCQVNASRRQQSRILENLGFGVLGISAELKDEMLGGHLSPESS